MRVSLPTFFLPLRPALSLQYALEPHLQVAVLLEMLENLFIKPSTAFCFFFDSVPFC